MPSVNKQAKINASAAKVWAIVGQFDTLGQWLPPVASCDTVGTGIGAVRTITMQDGASVQERLDAHDDKQRTQTYSMIDTGPLPLVDYQSTIAVNAEPDGQSTMTWSSTFGVSGAPETEVAEMVESLYVSGIEAVIKHIADTTHPAIANWPSQAIG